jgi:hypothetical protein
MISSSEPPLIGSTMVTGLKKRAGNTALVFPSFTLRLSIAHQAILKSIVLPPKTQNTVSRRGSGGCAE